MKKVIAILMLLILTVTLCSCMMNNTKVYYHNYGDLPKVSAKTLVDNALNTLQDEDIMNVYSFSSSSRGSYNSEVFCYYYNQVGYMRRTSVEQKEYTIEYYLDGTLYSSWYYHLFSNYFSNESSKNDFNLDVNSYMIKADEHYKTLCDYLSGLKGYPYLGEDYIKGKTYYNLEFYFLEDDVNFENLNYISLYFNKNKQFVGCEMIEKNGQLFSLGTFNRKDGTLMGEEYKSVYEWMNYPDSFMGEDWSNLKDRLPKIY